MPRAKRATSKRATAKASTAAPASAQRAMADVRAIELGELGMSIWEAGSALCTIANAVATAAEQIQADPAGVDTHLAAMREVAGAEIRKLDQAGDRLKIAPKLRHGLGIRKPQPPRLPPGIMGPGE